MSVNPTVYQNYHVPNMKYHSDLEAEGPSIIHVGGKTALPAADADGILAAHDISVAGPALTSAFASTYADANMGDYGRNVTIALSGTGTPDITIKGRDWLGQPMSETLTANGTTAVVGKKAFAFIDEIGYVVTASRTLNVGWGNVLGIPFKVDTLLNALEDSAIDGSATFVAAVDTQTATSGDPRGTLDFSNDPNGTRLYRLEFIPDRSDLHGSAHYYA